MRENLKAVGEKLENAGDLLSAQTTYLELAELGDVDGLVQAGRLAYMLGNHELKNDVWFKACELGRGDVCLILGLEARDQRDFEKARSLIKKGIDSGDSNAPLELGFIERDQGHMNFARELFTLAYKRGVLRGLYELAYTDYITGDFSNALTGLKKALDFGYNFAALNIGRIYAERDELDHARKYFRLACEKKVETAFSHLGILERCEGNPDEAKALFLKATRDGDLYGALNLGIMETDHGNFSEAINYLHQVFESEKPELLQSAHKSLGDAHKGMGNLIKAQEHYEFACLMGDESACEALR